MNKIFAKAMYKYYVDQWTFEDDSQENKEMMDVWEEVTKHPEWLNEILDVID